ncbi:MAG: YesL family protein [Eubacterium sp.]|nr:YesL family protein [Eubacterium sp.]
MEQRQSRLQGENNLVIRVSTMLTNLLLINFLTLLTCLPVITIGASLTAMHDCLQQILRKEDGYIARRFFKSFRSNFKQATLLWLPFLLIFSGVVADVIIMLTSPGLLPNYILIPAGVAGLLTLFIFQWLCPILARFSGSSGLVLRMTFLLATARFPRTVLMAATLVLPYFAARSILTLPLFLMFGISVPGMIGACLYRPVFRELEEEPEQENNRINV